MYNDRIIVHICGPGCCGKDFVAQTLAGLTGLKYKHSTSYGAAPLFYQAVLDGEFEDIDITKDTYKDLDDCFAHRNETQYMRRVWAVFIDQINKSDPTKLYKMCIENGNDILTGIRKEREIDACMSSQLIDLNIWVCNGFKYQNEDVTLEYGPEKADLILMNEFNENPNLAKVKLTQKLVNIITSISNIKADHAKRLGQSF